jgi:hypothetical protein
MDDETRQRLERLAQRDPVVHAILRGLEQYEPAERVLVMAIEVLSERYQETHAIATCAIETHGVPAVIKLDAPQELATLRTIADAAEAYRAAQRQREDAAALRLKALAAYKTAPPSAGGFDVAKAALDHADIDSAAAMLAYATAQERLDAAIAARKGGV